MQLVRAVPHYSTDCTLSLSSFFIDPLLPFIFNFCYMYCVDWGYLFLELWLIVHCGSQDCDRQILDPRLRSLVAGRHCYLIRGRPSLRWTRQSGISGTKKFTFFVGGVFIELQSLRGNSFSLDVHDFAVIGIKSIGCACARACCICSAMCFSLLFSSYSWLELGAGAPMARQCGKVSVRCCHGSGFIGRGSLLQFHAF